MKINSLLFLLFAFAFSSIAFAQTVEITSKEIVYKRKNPQMEYKKTFTVKYPKVKAATPVVSKKIEAVLDYEKAFPGLNINEQINEEEYLSEAGYEVNFNKNSILDISLWYEGIGAYPSTFRKNFIINSKTGVRVRPADVFVNLPKLAAKVRTAQLAEIKKAKEEYKKEPESADFDGNEYFKTAKFTAVELNNFSVSDEGVTFNYNYEFPHVVLALQPDGKYFYSWTEIKPFIKPDGLLGQFIR